MTAAAATEAVHAWAAAKEASAAAGACPLCGAGDPERVSDAARFDPPGLPRMRPHRCAHCRIVFLHPRMTEAQQRAFYRERYRGLYHGDTYDLRTFHEARTPDAARRSSRLRADRLLTGSVLDVGSSTGRFLELARRSATDVLGVEPDDAQRRFANARGVPTLAALDQLPGGRRFDLITLFHVLEHVFDPVALLASLAQRLKPDGTLIVEVPNVDDALLTLYRIPAFEAHYYHPAHCWYFSRDTLRAVARRAGLLADIGGVQRYGLANHLSWALHGRPGTDGAIDAVVSQATDRSYRADLCREMTCDTLWMVARPGGPAHP